MGRMRFFLGSFVVLAVLAAGVGQMQAAIGVHTADFIPDASRSHFNGFELIPNNGTFFTGGGGPYTEDTIQVQQINGDPPNDIWVTFGFWGSLGSFSWYPSGGDHGYTTVSLAGGLDFQDVGFNYGTGGHDQHVTLYELLDNGVVVLSGSIPITEWNSSTNYLGFSGGGFDTIRLRDANTGGGTVTDGSFNALALDNIETSGAVPEPSTLVLWSGLGAVGAVMAWRRRKRQAG
jgi:hypothetical protein